MRHRVLSPAFETQTLPSPTATSSGTEPTSIVARTSSVEGSILETEPCFASISALTTQSDPSPEAMPIGSAPNLDRSFDLGGLRAGGTRRSGRAGGDARSARSIAAAVARAAREQHEGAREREHGQAWSPLSPSSCDTCCDA
jgi:hypothetical protein